MTTYTALAAEHIRQANIRGWRANRCAVQVHATIFGIIEEKGLSIIDMDRREVAEMVKQKYKFVGVIGLLFNGIIVAVIEKLVGIVFDWLIAQFQSWIDRNRATGSPFSVSVGRTAVMAELQPLFDGAMEVLR